MCRSLCCCLFCSFASISLSVALSLSKLSLGESFEALSLPSLSLSDLSLFIIQFLSKQSAWLLSYDTSGRTVLAVTLPPTRCLTCTLHMQESQPRTSPYYVCSVGLKNFGWAHPTDQERGIRRHLSSSFTPTILINLIPTQPPWRTRLW